MAQTPLASEALASAVHEAANNIDMATFLPLFSEHVLPHLPASNTDSIINAFQTAVASRRYVNMKNYSSSIDSQLQRLNAICYDRDAYEEQGEIMLGVADELQEWIEEILPPILTTRVDTYAALYESFKYMASTIARLIGCDLRDEWEDDQDYSLENPNKRVLYKGYGIKSLFLKVWRDLLLSALSKGRHNFVKINLRYLQRHDLMGEFEEIVQEEPEADHSNESDAEEGESLDDDWRPEAWKRASGVSATQKSIDVQQAGSLAVLRAAIADAKPVRKLVDNAHYNSVESIHPRLQLANKRRRLEETAGSE